MAEMRYRVLGRSGIRVSELCLGTMNFGGPTDEAEAQRIIGDALEHGVNFIDTADVYTDGRSEEILGRALEGRRHQVILATKVAQPVGDKGINDRGLSRIHVMRAVEASLRRLRTDHIDLYYTHRVDPRTPWEEVVRTFGDLIRQGKIRHWALSNVRGWHIAHVCHICRALGEPEPVAVQPYYNLMNRQPEVEVLPAAHAFGLGVVPYSPIARGVLTGKYRGGAIPGDSRGADPGWERSLGRYLRSPSGVVEAVVRAAEGLGGTPAQVALSWIADRPLVAAAILGSRTATQLAENLEADQLVLPDEIVQALDDVSHPGTPG